MAKRILVADDSETVLLLMTRRLEVSGYDVRSATDGTQVVELIEKGKDLPDLILLDAMMPRMSGVDALQKIRAGGCEIPVLMVSAHLDASEPERMKAIGANGSIPKPFDWDELLARIEELI